MNLDPDFATVVFSGGQDSTTCLGHALARYGKVQCVTFDYNQKHSRELVAAADVIAYFVSKTGRDIPHTVVTVGDIFAGMSPLTNRSEELETYSSPEEMEAIIGDRVEKTFVPMRNAVFLMLAANRAAAAGSGVLVTGVCQADNANYPDCRQSFVDAAELTVERALGLDIARDAIHPGFSIDTPLMHRSKAETVRFAMDLPHTYEALAWSHTAYSGEYPPITQDHATVLRAAGFAEAGVPDPLLVRAWKDGLIPLPAGDNYDRYRAKGE